MPELAAHATIPSGGDAVTLRVSRAGDDGRWTVTHDAPAGSSNADPATTTHRYYNTAVRSARRRARSGLDGGTVIIREQPSLGLLLLGQGLWRRTVLLPAAALAALTAFVLGPAWVNGAAPVALGAALLAVAITGMTQITVAPVPSGRLAERHHQRVLARFYASAAAGTGLITVSAASAHALLVSAVAAVSLLIVFALIDGLFAYAAIRCQPEAGQPSNRRDAG